ncbi:MAG: hypothetical protein STSR0008_00400 [Ignavibacterium sp.]
MKFINQKLFLMYFFIVIFSIFFVVGCSDDETVQPATENLSKEASQDVSESVSSSLGQETGGATYEMSVISMAATPEGVSSLSKSLAKTGDSETPASTISIYDSINGIWNITVSREWSQWTGIRYAKVNRQYTLQYLNKLGVPQKYWIVGSDTAYSIKFKIISGTGEHVNIRLSQKLTSLSGDFTATGINTNLITVNGTYSRAATDTIKTRNSLRTSVHSVNLNFTNVTFERGEDDCSNTISGQMSGTFNTHITFLHGDLYKERDINTSINIDVSNSQGVISVSGNNYKCNISFGELDD